MAAKLQIDMYETKAKHLFISCLLIMISEPDLADSLFKTPEFADC